MLNRRKAMVGWLAYKAAKPIVRRALRSRAKGAVPGRRGASRVPNNAAILATLAAVAGGLVFWRNRKSGEGEPPES